MTKIKFINNYVKTYETIYLSYLKYLQKKLFHRAYMYIKKFN